MMSFRNLKTRSRQASEQEETLKITLIAYAVIKDAFPENPLQYEIAEGTTAEQLVSLLAMDFPAVADILPYTRVGHQDDYVDKKVKLKADSEYFLIPPVSGGGSDLNFQEALLESTRQSTTSSEKIR